MSKNIEMVTTTINMEVYGAEEVAKILTCSRATAYRTIDKLNRELDKKGYLTFSGKISKKYFEERLYI